MATQILPILQYPTTTNQLHSFSSTESFAKMTAYDRSHDEPYHFVQPEFQTQQIFTVSSPSLITRQLSRHSSTRSSKAHSCRSPRHDRTRIRRRTAPGSRPLSHSREEHMAIAVADQAQVHSAQPAVLQSHSAPLTPQILRNQSNYPLQNGVNSYDTSCAFLTPATSPSIPSSTFNYQPGQHRFPEYYQMNNAVSQVPLTRANLDPQSAIYVPPSPRGAEQNPQNSLPPSTLTPVMEPLFPQLPFNLESAASPTATAKSAALVSAAPSASNINLEIASPKSKPQCWDHGCNGRQFSTVSNLLRHQREKSGRASKAVCPECGMQFTRTTARNGHRTGGKCKGRVSNPINESPRQNEDGRT